MCVSRVMGIGFPPVGVAYGWKKFSWRQVIFDTSERVLFSGFIVARLNEKYLLKFEYEIQNVRVIFQSSNFILN